MAAESPPPSRQELREGIKALPHVGQKSVLDMRAVLAALVYLEDTNPELRKRLKAQTTFVEESFQGELEQLPDENGKTHYIVPQHILRAIVARGVIAGALQAAYDVGRTLKDIDELQELFGATISGDELRDGDATEPPAIEPPGDP